MLVDGKAIQTALRKELSDFFHALDREVRVDLVYVGSDPVIDTYIGIKEQFAHEIGVSLIIHRLPEDSTEDNVHRKIEEIIGSGTNGIVVQLPVPSHIDQEVLVNLVPQEVDIDVLSRGAFNAFIQGESEMIPPVAGAVREIMERYSVDLKGKDIVVVGRGKLVGKPVALWLLRNGTPARILDKEHDLRAELQSADVIISGAGSPNLITKDLIKEGVILIDAGTSVEGGTATGDIDRNCEGKASLFAAVPGGVGPLTVATLFRNLATTLGF